MYTNSNESSSGFHKQKLPEYKCLLSSENLREIFSSCGDYESREIILGLEQNISLTVCWLDGLVSGTAVAEEIIRPLTQAGRSPQVKSQQQCLEYILLGAAYSYSAKVTAPLSLTG